MISELTPYPVMKDSGVAWLGEVPGQWDIRRLGSSVTACVNGVWGGEPDGVNDLPCVRVADFDRFAHRTRTPIPTLRAIKPGDRQRRLLQRDDLLLEKSGGGDLQPVGVVVLYDHSEQAVCSNFVARMPAADGYVPRFLTYLHSHLYAIGLNIRSVKQTTGIQNLDSRSYLSEPVAFPPPDEQAAIVRFLDHADRKIRRAIRAKQKLVKLLEEEKQAIIHRAVTRGLDRNVRLKPSGVEWLGDVPEHWQIRRLKSLVHRIDQGVSPQAENYPAEGDAWGVLKAGCVNGGVFRENEHKRLPNGFAFDRELAVHVGDVLISRASGSPHLVGSTGRVEAISHNLILSDKTFRAVFDGHTDQDFMVLTMNSHGYRIQVQQAISGAEGLANNLPLSSLRDFVFAIPSLDEQQRIAHEIRSLITREIRLCGRAEREISLLREYRTRLIADVVTGKLDVREAAARLPDDAPDVDAGSEADSDDADEVTEPGVDDGAEAEADSEAA